MITIDEFMTSDPYTLRENDSLNDARAIMTEKNIRHIPITNSDQHLLGLITQRDILAATDPSSKQQTKSAPHEGDTDIKLSEIMIQDVSTIHTSAPLRQAAIYIQSHKYGCLPVVNDNDCLVGIITDSDFIDIAINLLEQVEIAEEEVVIDTDDTMDDMEMPELEEQL